MRFIVLGALMCVLLEACTSPQPRCRGAFEPINAPLPATPAQDRHDD